MAALTHWTLSYHLSQRQYFALDVQCRSLCLCSRTGPIQITYLDATSYPKYSGIFEDTKGFDFEDMKDFDFEGMKGFDFEGIKGFDFG